MTEPPLPPAAAKQQLLLPQEQPMNTADDDYPEVMREIARVVATAVAEAGIEPGRAIAIGDAAAEAVRENHGGTLLYLPKGHTLKTRRRWQAIWDEFTGDNHERLALRHGMNVKGIYKVIATMRAEMRKRQQADLFEADKTAGPAHGGEAIS